MYEWYTSSGLYVERMYKWYTLSGLHVERMYKWYTSSGLHVERMYIIPKKIPLPPLNSLKGLKIKPFSHIFSDNQRISKAR